MRVCAFLTAAALVLTLAGCGGTGLYSHVKYNVRPAAGEDLQALLSNNGAPDVQGQVGNITLVGWHGTDCMSIWDRLITGLPLFGKGTKPSYAALVDSDGKVITASRGRPGELLSVLYVLPAPVQAWEDTQ
jgi:hypothetical protein